MTTSNPNSGKDKFQRPKVLLLAYSCMPRRGSEPGIGWNRAKEISRYCDVWAICNEQGCKGPIESYLASNPDERTVNFVYVPRDRLDLTLEKLPGLFYVGYRQWHRRAFKVARRLHEEIGFDLTHQTTFIGFREPSELWKLDVPFVWGPIGGTHNFPTQFLGSLPIAARINELTRNLVNQIQIRTNRRVRQAAKQAARIFVASRHAQYDFKRITTRKTKILCDVGIQAIPDFPARPPSDTLKIIWSGVLTARKALDIGLEALAQVPDSIAWELNVLGQGPMYSHWQQLACRLGIRKRIHFHGNLTHAQAMTLSAMSDCFLFSSLRDTTGTVLPEALSLGLPIICLDHQGAADCVDKTCGIKVQVSDRQTTIQDLASAVTAFAQDRHRLREMSKAARERAQSYLWSKQAETLAAAYNEVFADTGQAVRCDVTNSVVNTSASPNRDRCSGRSSLPGSADGTFSAAHSNTLTPRK